MLICFGIAWPINIYKSLKSRSTGGKSPFFSIIVNLGYVCGILHKILFNPDLVMILYFINFITVSVDLFLFYHNRKYEREQAANMVCIPVEKQD